MVLTSSADDDHLRRAYGIFAAEARDVGPGYAPETVNADGRAVTRNAFLWLFPTVAVILCFLHGFLKVRDRCRRIWEVYRTVDAGEFRIRMGTLRSRCAERTWTAPVREALEKLEGKTEAYAAAYDHPGCHRTSDAVDRPMYRLCRLIYAGRGLHGHQGSSERRLRGWALLQNFRPYAPRGRVPRPFDSPAHRLNGKRYHEHWPHNLMVSTSRMGFRAPKPAIR